MKSIIIGFSKPTKFSLHAWIIEKIDGAPFDHAYLRFHSDSLNRDIIYQAVGKGVEFVGFTLWSTTTTPVQEFSIQIPDDSYTRLMQFCIDNAGIPYSFLGVIGAGLVKLRLCKINPWNQGLQAEFCSEIVARCLNTFDPSNFQNPSSITPDILYKTLLKIYPQ